MNELYGKPGLAMIISLMENPLPFPVGYGEAPYYAKNGNPCSLDDPVQMGTILVVHKG